MDNLYQGNVDTGKFEKSQLAIEKIKETVEVAVKQNEKTKKMIERYKASLEELRELPS